MLKTSPHHPNQGENRPPKLVTAAALIAKGLDVPIDVRALGKAIVPGAWAKPAMANAISVGASARGAGEGLFGGTSCPPIGERGIEPEIDLHWAPQSKCVNAPPRL